jgi:hypothetical protein
MADSADLKTFEQHAADAKTAPWLVAATKAYFDVAQGREMTRADYDAKVAEVAGSKISAR